jgi:hypothetical protein
MKGKITAIVGLVVFAAFGLITASAQSDRTVLRIESVKITKTECGKPLEFQITIKNDGANGYNKPSAIIITSGGNRIGREFQMNIAAGQKLVDVQSSLNAAFLADCCKEVCFEVSLAQTLNGGVNGYWDKVAYKICTKPGNVVVVRR